MLLRAVPTHCGRSAVYLALDKAAMYNTSLRGGEFRLPLVGLTEKEKAELRDVLKAMKIIEGEWFSYSSGA